MRSPLRSLRPVRYEGSIRCASDTIPGVTFTIRRMSLGRRIALAEAIRDLAQEMEFQQAGQSVKDQVQAAVLSGRIDLIYLRWGLSSISGLLVDSQPATADQLFASGPEDLLREIVDRIKRECGLTDDERKN